jgi:Family of unknown function (DUF6069)
MTSAAQPTQRLETRQLLPLAAIGGIVGAALNVAVALVAPVLIGQPLQVIAPNSPEPQPLLLVAVILASIVPAFFAAGVLWLLGRFTRAPVRNFQILGGVFALLSLFGSLGMPVGLGTQLTLSLMHLIAAASIILALSRARA